MPTIKKLLTVAPRMRNSMPRKAQKGDTITAVKGSVTPVPNGPLVKKKGPYAGSTLKKGGTVPKGYHRMPNGKFMKNSAHKGKKK